jgi:diphthamide biosynthesis enzyme Dph1/Dph2-like protein
MIMLSQNDSECRVSIQSQTHSYDSDRALTGQPVWREEGGSTNRALSRRYFLVQKAKDCEIIGIVAGTLAVGTCFELSVSSYMRAFP